MQYNCKAKLICLTLFYSFMISPIFASTCKKAICKEFCNRKISTISVVGAA